MDGSDQRSFRVLGTIEELETGRPLRDLIVRAFDRDLLFDDKIGFATTDADGRFEIRFGREDFRDVNEARPDLYLRVYDPSGLREIDLGEVDVRRDASRTERFRLRVPARALRQG